MANPHTLQDLVARAIARITGTGVITDVSGWHRQMDAVLARGHTAAVIAGVAERSVGGRIRAALSHVLGMRALARPDRDLLLSRLTEQRRYLANFANDVQRGALTPAQIVARAALYAAATRATYSAARWSDAYLPAHPGDGSSECLVHCQCQWVQRADGYYWTLGTSEHCPTCLRRASEWSPYRATTLSSSET